MSDRKQYIAVKFTREQLEEIASRFSDLAGECQAFGLQTGPIDGIDKTFKTFRAISTTASLAFGYEAWRTVSDDYENYLRAKRTFGFGNEAHGLTDDSKLVAIKTTDAKSVDEERVRVRKNSVWTPVTFYRSSVVLKNEKDVRINVSLSMIADFFNWSGKPMECKKS